MSKKIPLEALVFDVFGTVVDWRGSLLRELKTFAADRWPGIDWEGFVDDWRGGYPAAMQRVRSGELPWRSIDQLHRLILDELLVKYAVTGMSEDEARHVNRAWHRLDPWPDVAAGLARLKRHFIIGTLSNGNMGLLVAMAKRAGLPWDCVFSAEIARHYKPDPEAYLMPPTLLGLQPSQVMLVAAHPSDLAGAARAGLRTGYVPRPLEWGPPGRKYEVDGAAFDVVAKDFGELADFLGAR
ncbi:MAG TPA: haloacid dehalogenase type II [Stellaceae bacterium]|nr:haloacid dehalogenase type II [Stellaceae bacterium]